MSIFSVVSLHDIYLIFFSIGLAIGAGATLLNGMSLLTVLKDRHISSDEYHIINGSYTVVWAGLLLYAFFGIGLFTMSYEAMLRLGIFQASMVVALILVINTFLVHYWLLPAVKSKLDDKKEKEIDKNIATYFAISVIVSIVSWLFLVVHHALFRAEISFWLAISLYFLALLFIGYLYISVISRILNKIQKNTIYKVGGFLIILLAITLSTYYFVVFKNSDSKIEKSSEEVTGATVYPTFPLSEVAKRSNIEECWVVIAGEVYDVTPAAEKYPELYECGKDITTAYQEMSPDGISDRVRSYHIGSVGFDFSEVQSNNTKDSCWLVIDNMVFDATPEAKLHPAAFNCGTDASINYHRNHGSGVSDKMMRMYIGRIDEGVTIVPDGNPVEKKTQLKPYAELYVEAGSWDNRELMMVVEKDAEKLLFLDGRTHNELGRIHDIGFQPHTSVFSPDAKYMYIISRDGWLTKVDLDTFNPVISIDVGDNSRGTALTDDGKYLAIGNYAPGNVVIIDSKTMKILKTIPTTGELNGEKVESRVGAVVQKGSSIIVALKDLNSVWVIDATDESFPVKNKYWNIGGNETPLHDAYLTPDGNFYIVAAMGANKVWVLDTKTWTEVAEVQTGDTPHTGPGATWGTTTYVPAIGEGLITAIDTKTWKPIAYIETAGPGLFIRSYHKNPDYPYVWADTAFGDHHDEIYVIDARTNKIVKTIIPVAGESSWHPEFTFDGKYVYVVSQTANEIEVYDAYDFSLVKRITAHTPSAVSNVGLRIEEPGL